LTAPEADFLRAFRPGGIIIFSRNFSDNAQLARLVQDARSAAGLASWLVLVDQEGGRVQRLCGGGWPDFPAAALFGALYRENAADALAAAESCSQWLAGMLRDVGINVNCAPCLDVPVAGADAIIGDRAYGDEVETVAAVGRAVARGMIAGGVVPVIKHIPGHGRAGCDSHLALPVVAESLDDLCAQDFVPFQRCNDLPAAMTAHVMFRACDTERPASVSAAVIADIIRGRIGFDGLLMSDDVSMQALEGSIRERAQAVLAAGSDMILHCNGRIDEMQQVAAVAPELCGAARRRYQRCLAIAMREPVRVDDVVARAALSRVRRTVAGDQTDG